MAATFDVRQYTKIKGICAIFVLVCVLTVPVTCRRRKHPPVKAFFQGDCRHHICEQKCRDIDHGGYACECHHSYTLDPNGISCSKFTKDHLDTSTTLQTEGAPVEITFVSPGSGQITSLDTDRDLNTDGTHRSNDFSQPLNNDLSFGSSFLRPIPNHSEKQSKHSVISISKDHFSKKPTNKYQNAIDSDTRNIIPSEDTTYNSDNIVLGGENGASLGSIKIITLDQKPEGPSLEPQELKTSETSNNENYQNLVPNYLPDKVIRKDPVSQTKHTAGTTETILEWCNEFSCLNNGKCMDDGTDLRRKVRCDCPLGTHGEKCQHVVDVRYPRFHGNSYLALPVLRDGFKELEVLLEFKPSADSGLVFLSSEFEDTRSDYFSIALIAGFVELRFDCGTGMGVLRSSSPVAMDTWNIVKVHRLDKDATLWLNQDPPVHGRSQGSFTRLTFRLPLYIGGFEKMATIQHKVGTSQGFMGCVEEVIVNGYKYDLRKAGLVGDAQFGVNVGECSAGLCDRVSCENGGECQVTSADTHICLCPLGTGGENCQHILDVHIPAFQGHSYLEFEGLGRTSLLYMELELVFKPTKADGLILYNGYMLDRSGDFLSLALHSGYLEYRFDLGTGPAIIRSREPLEVNQWHMVKLSRTGMEGVLEVDKQRAVIGQSQGAFTQLTVTQNMYVGGHRNFDETSRLANVSLSFDGCIQKLMVNSRHVHLLKDAILGMNVVNCDHPCVGAPCMNGGQCQPKHEAFVCTCPLGFKGHNCQKQVALSLEIPKFSSNSYLQFTQRDVVKHVGGNKLDLHVSIKPDPDAHEGLFFWIGPDAMETTSDYMALGMHGGAVQFRYNLGSGEAVLELNISHLFDGKWHHIHAQRDKQNGILSIDDTAVVRGSSQGSYTMLNTNKKLYIGGMPRVGQETFRKFTTGFKGCLKDLVLGGHSMTSALSSATDGQNVVPCT